MEKVKVDEKFIVAIFWNNEENQRSEKELAYCHLEWNISSTRLSSFTFSRFPAPLPLVKDEYPIHFVHFMLRLRDIPVAQKSLKIEDLTDTIIFFPNLLYIILFSTIPDKIGK